MRLTLPQPLHGWRGFIGEVGIIVLGVLIALGAGQLVDAWQWKQQVTQSDDLFREEMDAASSNAYMHLAVAPCLDARLDVIAAKLNEGGAAWHAISEDLNWEASGVPEPRRPKAYRGSSGFSQITTEAWTNALASGTVNHISLVKGVMLSRAYSSARQLLDDEREERKAVSRLVPLAADQEFDAGGRIAMVENLDEVRRINRELENDSRNVLLAAQQAGLGYSRAKLHADNAFVFDLEQALRGACVTKPKLPCRGPRCE
jgi:hypothetical protein